MEITTIITLCGMILVNASALIAAWIKMKTDITAINVKILDIDARVTNQEMQNSKKIDGINTKLEKFYDTNATQHETISIKIDNIKDSITDLKVAVVKNGNQMNTLPKHFDSDK